jgi:hypothetical protein
VTKLFLQAFVGIASGLLTFGLIAHVYGSWQAPEKLLVEKNSVTDALGADQWKSYVRIGATKALDKDAVVGVAYRLADFCGLKGQKDSKIDGKDHLVIATLTQSKNSFDVKGNIENLKDLQNKCNSNIGIQSSWILTDSNEIRREANSSGLLNQYVFIGHGSK